MAFLFVEPTELVIETDDKTGELTTFRLRLKELQPRSFNLNLLKHQDRFTFAELQEYIKAKQPLMMPINEGKLRDGTPYFQLLEGDVIPVDRNYALKKQQEEEKKLRQQEEQQRLAKQQQQPQQPQPVAQPK